ncbi:AEC family transporter [Corynebacterium breve]|uniref:AEC family transporter n=1 Tax=Corynebacterium breve TaxID=3049799 RepID=A0ABY8VFC0_9CORY|nr:AEC family transporter [Corynebacterium breve]WIM68037.1 AEC family transporter [Corynebacterium breve]
MLSVITGFAIIFAVIGTGYLLARKGVIPPGKQRLMFNKVAFYAATPSLLFSSVVKSDLSTFFSPVVLVVLIATVATAVLYWVFSAIFFRQGVPTTSAGASSASYFNSVNIGLPISIYVIGDATWVIPVLVMQMVLFTPFVIAGLTFDESGTGSRARKIGDAIRTGVLSPVVISPLVGLVVAGMNWTVPEPVLAPIEILGGASIPMILMSFGASLRGGAVLDHKPDRPAILTASALKIAVMPLIAWAVGMALGLPNNLLYAGVILSALPTAQNVYNYAATYQRGEIVARDTVFITTFAALPAMIVIALLFGN